MIALLRAAGSVEGFVEGRLDKVGLSIPRLAALQRLSDAGGVLPFGQLAERLACVKSNVTQLVERLEADRLVSRETDPSDKRSRLAVLTDAGRQALAEGARVQREAEQELFSSLSDDDRDHLSAIIDKLKAAAAARCR
jgi:DNA-binding MarR family transcriptional regulator